jgi:hypothetical protein
LKQPKPKNINKGNAWMTDANFLVLIYHQLPVWTREHLEAAFYLQTVVLGKSYYDFGLPHPVGQDLGGFQEFKDGGRFPAVKTVRRPSIR